MSEGRSTECWLTKCVNEISGFLNLKNHILLIVLVLGAISIFILRDRLLLATGDFLVVQDSLHPVDVIHVIAGEDYRTEHAIQLYEQGYGKYLFLHGHHGGHREGMALAQGVPIEAIGLDNDHPITSTYSETVLLKEWINQSGVPVRSVIVVSDPFHMRRARWIHQQVLGAHIEILMAPVPFEHTPFQRNWWKDPGSRLNVRDEYVKSVYNLARYQLSWGGVKDWLASMDQN